MKQESIIVSNTDLKPIPPIQSPVDNNFVLDKTQRCLAMLDLIDSHIIASLGTFSTPIDYALESIRSELNELEQSVKRQSRF